VSVDALEQDWKKKEKMDLYLNCNMIGLEIDLVLARKAVL